MAVFQKVHAGRVINQNDVAKLFADAHVKAATANNAINGFKTTGLFPTNRYIFDDTDFLPASVTDNPLNPTESAQLIEKPLPLEEAHKVAPSPSMLEDILITQNLFSPENMEEHVTPLPPHSLLQNRATMPPQLNSQGYVDNLDKLMDTISALLLSQQ